MGQKIHPTGFRLSVNRGPGDPRWFAAEQQDLGHHAGRDIKVARSSRRSFAHASISKIIIERPPRTRASPCSFPPRRGHRQEGRGHREAAQASSMPDVVPVTLNIEEVRKPEIEAQPDRPVHRQPAGKGIMFRRAMA